MKQGKIKKILLVNPFGIGDVLFSTPLVKALRDHYPGAFIGYLCNRRTEQLLATNSNIDEVFVYEKDEFRRMWSRSKTDCLKKFLQLLLSIKKKKFEVLIDLSLGHQYSLLSMLIGIRTRIGFNYKKRGRFLTQKTDIEGYEGKHIVDYYLSLLRFLNIKVPETARLEFFTEPTDDLWAEDFLRDHKLNKEASIVAIIPGGGASWGEKAVYKHWGEEKYSRLIERLSKELTKKVIIFGGSGEAEKCAKIASLSKVSPINACGDTDLGRLAALLRSCDLVITNDGGPLHVAVSQFVPTISIFGPVDEAVYGPYPWDENNAVIKRDLDCRPCYKKFKIPECNNRICLQDIKVEDVFDTAKQMLSRKAGRSKKAGYIHKKVPVTVVVLTRNEEANIAECLRSVAWADELIVVDDFSTDKTCEIASRYTDKVFEKKMEIEGAHRNWAYSQARNEWILSLDADEKVSFELKREIERLIKDCTELAAFSIPLRNYIGKHWVRYGGWYPAGKVRLFRKDKFKYEETGVHPRVFIDGKCGHLKSDIIHRGYPDIGHFLDSLNRQTTLEAQKWLEDKRKMSFARAFRKAHDRFFKTLVLKKGYKDGFIGFMVAFFAALYQIISYAKYWELKNQTKSRLMERSEHKSDD